MLLITCAEGCEAGDGEGGGDCRLPAVAMTTTGHQQREEEAEIWRRKGEREEMSCPARRMQATVADTWTTRCPRSWLPRSLFALAWQEEAATRLLPLPPVLMPMPPLPLLVLPLPLVPLLLMRRRRR